MIDVNTQVLGLIGHPLGHSFSPQIHNYAVGQLNLNYVYLCFDIKPSNLKEGIGGLKALQFKGVNVTIPYKEMVIPYLDSMDSLASDIQAVNTIVNNNGKLTGYNTDASGFKRMLEEDGNFDIKDKNVLIIGAGGASRAVGSVLCKNGINELYLINRSVDKSEKLCEIWKEHYPAVKIKSGALDEEYYNELLGRIDLIVDTTPVGMSPEIDVEPVISTEKFHSNLLVCDLVYNPVETTLLKAAKKAGASILNGSGMLLYQAIDAFELWTGQDLSQLNWPDHIRNFS